MAKRLTDIAAKAAQPGAARREIADGGVVGLYLIVQPGGAKSWALRYRADGQSRKLTLGASPAIGLAEARRRARLAIGEIAKGHDPAAVKRAERAASKAEAAAKDDLIENVVADFIRLYAARHTRDWQETERLLVKNVVAAWQGRRLASIEKKDVVKLLDEIVARGAPVGANRILAQLRKMGSWAVDRALILRSPCEGVKRPSPEFERDRALAPDEIVLVLKAAESLPPAYRDIVKLLISTGQRRDEITGMRWGEINADLSTWTLPASRAKNRREHVIPLSSAARAILAALSRGDPAALVFSDTGRVLTSFSEAKRRLDAAIVEINGGRSIPPWVLHDLRRTMATGMAELNIAPHIVEAALNHRSGVIRGVAAIYNRYKYETEKRSAFEAWARRLAMIVSGETADNVIAQRS